MTRTEASWTVLVVVMPTKRRTDTGHTPPGIADNTDDMVRPTARVLALLELLQAGGTHTVADLAQRLAVDERTVRRYVEHLRDLDVPVDAVRGRYGGYRLARHYRMPPLMLTDEEALAVVWALLLSRQSGSGQRLCLRCRARWPRCAACCPRRSHDGSTPSSTPSASPRPGTTTARPVTSRADDGSAHSPAGPGRSGERPAPGHVRVHGAAGPGGAALRAAARCRGPPRPAVPHRIRRHAAGPADIPPRPHRPACACSRAPSPRRPIPTRCSRSSARCRAAPWRHDVSFRIRADIAHVRTRIPETLASVTPASADAGTGDGWLRVFLRAERLEWVAGTLAMLDRPFVIESPQALRDMVAALGQRLIAAAGADNGDRAARNCRRPPS